MTDLDSYLPAIQAGDADAFERWLAGAEARVRLSLRGFAAAVDTEAVLQETMLRAWQVAPRCQPDGRPDCLLRMSIRIARNLAISEARRLRTVREIRELQDDAPEVVAEATEPDPMLRTSIVRCFERLPNKPREALSLRLDSAGSEPDAALAERAGMTLNTFLQNFTRARRFLAECLQGLGIDLPAVVS